MVANGEDARGVIEELRDLGFNLVRVLTTARYLFDLPADRGRAALPTLLSLLKELGVGAEIVALADTRDWPRAQLRDHLQAVYQLCEAFDWGVVEGGNEIGPVHDTQHDDIVDVCRAFTPRGLPYCPGSVHGGQFCEDEALMTEAQRQVWERERKAPYWDEIAAYAGTYGTSHLKRGDDRGERIRHVRELHGRPQYFVDDEPMGADEGYRPGKRDDNPSAFFGQGMLAPVFSLGVTFHSECGLRSERLKPVQRRCAEAFIRGANIVGDTLLTYKNTGWADSPIQSMSGATRVYSGVSATDNIACVVGATPALSIQTWNGYQLGPIRDQEGEMIVYDLLRS